MRGNSLLNMAMLAIYYGNAISDSRFCKTRRKHSFVEFFKVSKTLVKNKGVMIFHDSISVFGVKVPPVVVETAAARDHERCPGSRIVPASI